MHVERQVHVRGRLGSPYARKLGEPLHSDVV